MDCIKKSQIDHKPSSISANIGSKRNIKQLYQGCSVALLSQVPYSIILISSFDYLENTVFNDYKTVKFNKFDDVYFVEKFVARFGAAMFSMLLAQSICYPLDTVKRCM